MTAARHRSTVISSTTLRSNHLNFWLVLTRIRIHLTAVFGLGLYGKRSPAVRRAAGGVPFVPIRGGVALELNSTGAPVSNLTKLSIRSDRQATRS